MKIVVLTKEVPDTWSDRKLDLESGLLVRSESDPVPDEINERALESALKFKDENAQTEVIVLAMGPAEVEKSLRKLLAMGADSGIILADGSLSGSDMMQTSRVLATALRRIDPDVVIAGDASTDGRGGIVPAMIAELLSTPILPGLDSLSISASSVEGRAQIDGGTMNLNASLPAVVSVTEASAEARFPNFKGIMQAKKKPIDVWSLTDLGITAGPESASVRSVMVGAAARPPKQAGPKIFDDGNAASQLADFLATNRLI